MDQFFFLTYKERDYIFLSYNYIKRILKCTARVDGTITDFLRNPGERDTLVKLIFTLFNALLIGDA